MLSLLCLQYLVCTHFNAATVAGAADEDEDEDEDDVCSV